MIESRLQAKPDSRVPALIQERLIKKRLRRPNTPMSQPEMGINRVCIIMDVVTTHWIWSRSARRLVIMLGIAMPTLVESTANTRPAKTTVRVIHH